MDARNQTLEATAAELDIGALPGDRSWLGTAIQSLSELVSTQIPIGSVAEFPARQKRNRPPATICLANTCHLRSELVLGHRASKFGRLSNECNEQVRLAMV